MKKYILLGCMIASAFAACQKDDIVDPDMPNIDEPQVPQITRTFMVAQDEWTRSAYVEGEGVKISGDEEISVYYGDHKYLSYDEAAASQLQKVTGTPNGDGTYSFSHGEIALAEAYDYYFVMPNTTTNNAQSKGQRPNVYLNTIQYPTATSFDPAQDYMVGTPRYAVDQQTSVGELHFKRLFAPFHVTFKGVPAGEKIRYATVMQSASCTRNSALVGTAYLSFEDPEKSGQEKKSAEFDHATINSWLSSGYGNHVTAYYAEGLTTTATGQGEVWYMINPTCYGTGDPTSISGDMTMWVVTDNKLLTRTVSLAKPIKFTANAINKMGFNITGSGYTEEDAFTQDFTALPAGNKNGNQLLTASNGIEYTWNFTSGCKVQNNGMYAPATGATFTLPKPAGQKIKQILILQGLSNPNNAGVSTLQLQADGENVGEPYDFNTQRMLTKTASGYLVIDVPAAYQKAQLSLVKPAEDNATYMAAMTFVTEPEPNDYFALYQNGENITFGEGANALTINKESHPGAQVVYLDTKDTHDKIRTMMQNGGVYFLDTYHNSDGSEVAAADTLLTWTSHFKPGGNTILIGRYKDKQANLSLSGTAAIYLSNSNGLSTLALKNLNIVSENAGYFFTINNESTQHIEALYVDDCSIDAPKHVYGYSKNEMNFVCKNTYFHNSLIKMSGVDENYSVFRMQKAVGSAAPYDYSKMPYAEIKRVEFVNCVFYATETVKCYVKDGANVLYRRTIMDAGNGDTDSGYQYPMTNLEIVFRNNTCYNIHANSNILIRAYIARSANIEHNIFYADGTIATSNDADQLAVTANCYIFGLYGHHSEVYAPADDSAEAITAAVNAEKAAYQVVNNYAMSYGSSMTPNGWTWVYKDGKPTNYTNSGNTGKWKQATANDCFASTLNAANGYFPVNTAKVTNGAGATYETKLWKAWE